MSVSLLKASEEEAVFNIEIDAETIETAIMEQYQNVMAGQETKISNLPLSNRALLAQYPDVGKLASQALDKILPAYYMDAIKELGITPMTFPQITPQESNFGEPCTVEVRVVLEPKIDVQKYEGLEASYVPVVVTEEDVAQQITGLREQRDTGDDDAKLLKTLPFDTIEAFTTEVRTSLQELAEEKTESNKVEAVMNKLLETNSCSLSEEVVEQQIMVQINQFRQKIGSQAMESYMKSSGRTFDDVKKEVRPEAEMMVKKNLLLTAIADIIDPEINDDDIKNAILKQEHSIMDAPLSYDDRRQRLEEMPGAMTQLSYAIRLEKTADYIVRNAILYKSEPQRVMDQLPDYLK